MSNASDIETSSERRGPPTADRFEKLGYGPKHQRKPLRELDPRSQLMCEYMLIGTHIKSLADRIGVEVNEPMSQQQASDAVGFRRRNGRFVFSQPVFQKALAKGIAELRSGHHVRAVLTQVELMNDPGDGSAAAGTLRLKASQALLGEEGKSGGVNVNVAIQNNPAIQLAPGIVVRLPSSAASPPMESMFDESGVIEHDPAPLLPVADNSGEPARIMFDESSLETMRRQHPHTRGVGND